jgi:DNA-3-methyladenine glycosylase
VILPKSFYTRDARVVARDLLGRELVTVVDGERTSGRISETEAYVGDDPASHSHRGPTQRNASMFRDGGIAYVYFIYGMYYCFNVVTGAEGSGEAVLIRAVVPTSGIEVMRRRRGRALKRDADLANGPGKLAMALAIGPEHNGIDLTAGTTIWIEEGIAVNDDSVVTTSRVGITRGLEHDWRWVAKID